MEEINQGFNEIELQECKKKLRMTLANNRIFPSEHILRIIGVIVLVIVINIVLRVIYDELGIYFLFSNSFFWKAVDVILLLIIYVLNFSIFATIYFLIEAILKEIEYNRLTISEIQQYRTYKLKYQEKMYDIANEALNSDKLSVMEKNDIKRRIQIGEIFKDNTLYKIQFRLKK